MADLNGLANANAELDKTVDDLSKAGNEAELDKALNAELNSQEGDTPANKTPENPDKPEGDTPEGDKDKTLSVDDKGSEKPNKFQDLLRDRNEAREAAAKADLEAQAKEQRIKDLEAENERLKSGDKGEGDKDPSADDKPLTRAEVERLLAERESSEAKKAAAEKADIAEVDALKDNKETPNAEEYRDDILEAMKKHPTMTAYAVYMMLRGAGKIPFDDASANSNAGKLNTGDRTKANLTRDKKPEDMSDEELEKAARDVAAQGGI